jgi:hypothetical protein
MNISLLRRLSLTIVAFALAPAAALASSSCYDQDQYPAVLRIEAAPGGFRAYALPPGTSHLSRGRLQP